MPAKIYKSGVYFHVHVCVFLRAAASSSLIFHHEMNLKKKKGGEKSYSSLSVVPLSGIPLSILINLKGPFPLLQEQQLIKWLISDGRVWMFWVNFIDLRAGLEGPERNRRPPPPRWGFGWECRFTPLSFKDTSKKNPNVHGPAFSAQLAWQRQPWLSLARISTAAMPRKQIFYHIPT